MARISIAPWSAFDAANDATSQALARRAESIPPGTCPVALQEAFVVSSATQSCGKCVPCRDGLPKLAELLHELSSYRGGQAALDRARRLALEIRDSADCAIGWAAADQALQGFETFADEYAMHIEHGTCSEGVGQTVPCITQCPAHVNIPGYIALVEQGDCAGAVKMVRKDNPFPTACALVCEHPCEARCRRMIIDAPINIRGIKKYAVDTAAADTVEVPERAEATGKRIAIVGGGPSGLTCAYYLALMGHDVVVYEERKQLGGMMRYGIPAYRLPRERLDEDIRAILSVGGIEVQTETRIDAAQMQAMAAEFDAVFVAIGAQAGKTLAIEGADAPGVMSAVELLGSIGDGDYPDFTGKNVVVIGAGNVAMDCARTSVRAGAKSVTVAYRRRLEDMTALPEEIEAAIAEGVEMMTLQAPVRIELDESGAARALVCQPQRIGAVRGGRPAPVAADKPELSLDADIVLVAIGQAIESSPFEEYGLQAERTRFVADEHLAAKDFDNIFVGGDCQWGPKTVIMAIAAGKTAARNIDEVLGFHHELDCGAVAPPARPNDRTAYGRVQIAERPARERKEDFDYVELSMSEDEAAQECGRCLRCDHFGIAALDERGLVAW